MGIKGAKKLIEEFNKKNENISEAFLNICYYLKQISNIRKMNNNDLIKAIERNHWGEKFEIIPINRLKNNLVSYNVIAKIICNATKNNF